MGVKLRVLTLERSNLPWTAPVSAQGGRDARLARAGGKKMSSFVPHEIDFHQVLEIPRRLRICLMMFNW
jgi:hypothetical protein